MKTNLITLLILDLPQLQFSQSDLSLLFLLSKSITFSDSFVCRVKWHWHMHLIRSFYLPETNAGSYQALSVYGRLDTKLHLIQHHLLLWLGACQSWEVHTSYTCWRQTHTRLPPLLRGLYFTLNYWSNWSILLGHRSFGSTLCSLLKALWLLTNSGHVDFYLGISCMCPKPLLRAVKSKPYKYLKCNNTI